MEAGDLAEALEHLLAEPGAHVHEGGQQAEDAQVGVELLASRLKGPQHLLEPLHRVARHLEGDQDPGCGPERADGVKAEVGRGVEQHHVVGAEAVTPVEGVTETQLAADGRGHLRLHRAQIGIRRNQGDPVPLGGEGHRLRRHGRVNQDVGDRPLELVGIEPEPGGQVRLRVDIDGEHPSAQFAERAGQGGAGGRLSDAPLPRHARDGDGHEGQLTAGADRPAARGTASSARCG